MGQQMKFVATLAQDDFNQNYADNTSFFLLEDFLIRAGNIAAGFYMAMFQQLKAEMRQEKRDEVVAFDPSVLSEQEIALEKKDKEWVGTIDKAAMSFPFDEQTSGYQLAIDLSTGEEIERSNINEVWGYKYMPETCRKFFRIEGDKLKIFASPSSATKKVKLLYVPSIKIGDGDVQLPDGMVDFVITGTVNFMRQTQQGVVIKKSLDNSQDKIMESEINKKSVTQ